MCTYCIQHDVQSTYFYPVVGYIESSVFVYLWLFSFLSLFSPLYRAYILRFISCSWTTSRTHSETLRGFIYTTLCYGWQEEWGCWLQPIFLKGEIPHFFGIQVGFKSIKSFEVGRLLFSQRSSCETTKSFWWNLPIYEICSTVIYNII